MRSRSGPEGGLHCLCTASYRCSQVLWCAVAGTALAEKALRRFRPYIAGTAGKRQVRRFSANRLPQMQQQHHLQAPYTSRSSSHTDSRSAFLRQSLPAVGFSCSPLRHLHRMRSTHSVFPPRAHRKALPPSDLVSKDRFSCEGRMVDELAPTYSSSACTRNAFSSYTNISVRRIVRSAHCHLRRELPQLVSDHVLRYSHIVVDLAVVNLKDEAHEVRKDGRASGLCFDRRRSFAGLGSHDGQTEVVSIPR